MNKQTKIGLVAGVIVLMMLVVWMMSSGDAGQKSKRKAFVSSNWSKRFQVFDKKPLGLYLFTSLADAHIDTNHAVIPVSDWIQYDTLVSPNKDKKTFMFVGNNFGLKSSEIDTILHEVEHGSDLFLAYNGLTENIYPRLFDEYEIQFDYAPSVNVFAGKQKFKMINLFQNDTIATDWKAFGDIVTHQPHRSLSSFMEMNNFIEIEYGEGSIFLHSTPIMFYNYQLKRLHGFKYAEFTLNQLERDRSIYLLELGRLSDNYGNEDVDENDGADGKRDDSYLRLIFENPTLLTALLLCILGIILFVIFRSKRIRPVVPFIQPKKDMTLAFTETITSIYFSKRNPYGLLQVQRKNFYATISKHFFLDLQKRDGDRTLEILAEKSNHSKEEIIDLMNRLETKEAFSVSEQYVVDMLKRIHSFYKKVGIISDKVAAKVAAKEFTYRRGLLVPAAFILGGLFLIILGVYYLMSSIGIGIVLWPIGMILFVLGVIRMSKPYMIVDNKTITHYSSLGRKTTYNKDDLISTNMKSSGVILVFKNNKKLIINYWDLSRFDQAQFKRFISKFHTLEL
ncbi:MAG: DUF4350 domain-containing protein [Crocinitomicaceae bacterium]